VDEESIIVRKTAMEYFACEELGSLERRLKCAIERKHELISMNLSGKWMAAAEADLSRTNALLMNHRQMCVVCNGRWTVVSGAESLAVEVGEEEYPPEDPERPFRAPPRRMYRPEPAQVLPMPSAGRGF